MASRSSSDHPESSHPYHVDRSQSTVSLELQGKKRSTGGFLGRFLPKSRRETLLPLPEGASLSSLSPPQLLPLSPLQSIHLPQPATDTTEVTAGDTTWAATYESPPLPPTTILGIPILQHPQPQLAQTSSGIISPFHSVPISQRPATTHSSTKEHRQSGASLYRSTTGNSTHESLYQSRNPSPVPHASQSPDSNDSSYWSNAIEQRPGRRARIHRRNWSRIARQLSAEPQPPPELLAPHESRYYEYITDETTGEGTLQEYPHRPDTPIPTIPDAGTISESTPEPPQSPSDPGSTSDDPV